MAKILSSETLNLGESLFNVFENGFLKSFFGVKVNKKYSLKYRLKNTRLLVNLFYFIFR